MANSKLKVVLVNASDTLGGAAIVTFRLMQALRAQGVDVRMVVYTKTSQEENVDFVGSRFLRGMAFCLERLRILPKLGFNYDNLFKVSTGDFALNVHRHPWVKEADIVCLNWINQGLMSVEGIRKLHKMGKKIVWTLHDMWAMTGICHHSYECEYYADACGNCQFLNHGGHPKDISAKYWCKKRDVYADVPIEFVAVSHWMEGRARRSSLLGEKSIRTIYNPFPSSQFTPEPLGIYNNAFLCEHKSNFIVFGAARIDDPIKGLNYTIDALNHIFDNYPAVASDSAVIFFGDIKHPKMLDRLRFSHVNLGRINDFKQLLDIYSRAKVVLSTSLYETLAGTLIEGQSCGAIPVTFAPDGRTDIVEHLKTGYIARYKDPVDIAEGILWALSADISRQSLHEAVKQKFDAPVIARQYINLFEEMMAR